VLAIEEECYALLVSRLWADAAAGVMPKARAALVTTACAASKATALATSTTRLFFGSTTHYLAINQPQVENFVSKLSRPSDKNDWF